MKKKCRLAHLGILKKDMSPYSYPILLIGRKNSNLKRIITDFRFLNSRLQRVDLAFPLMTTALAILGSPKFECLLVLDLKDAYHAIKLSENFKLYCGIKSHFGSAIYVSQRMPMGPRASPAILQSYISAILINIPDRSKYLVIMGDLLLHSSKHVHLKYLEDFLKILLKSGLKISPMKCQLLKTEVQYMGNTIFYQK